MWLNRFGISGGKPSITEIQLLLVGGGGATASGHIWWWRRWWLY
jgi:hypothetical protein